MVTLTHENKLKTNYPQKAKEEKRFKEKFNFKKKIKQNPRNKVKLLATLTKQKNNFLANQTLVKQQQKKIKNRLPTI